MSCSKEGTLAEGQLCGLLEEITSSLALGACRLSTLERMTELTLSLPLAEPGEDKQGLVFWRAAHLPHPWPMLFTEVSGTKMVTKEPATCCLKIPGRLHMGRAAGRVQPTAPQMGLACVIRGLGITQGLQCSPGQPAGKQPLLGSCQSSLGSRAMCQRCQWCQSCRARICVV